MKNTGNLSIFDAVNFKHTKSPVYLCSIVAVVLWGLSYIWCDRLLGQGIPVEYFIYVRVLMAGGILLIFNLATGTDIRINKKDLSKFLLLSLCEPMIYFICETYGIQFTESPTYSAMIIATTPIVALFAGVFFFKEKFNLTNILGLIVCILGIVMVTAGDDKLGDKFIIGIIMLVIAVFAEVGQASCTKWLSGTYKPQVITMHQFLIGSVYLCPIFFTKGLRHFDPQTYLSWSVWEPILFLALLCSCLSFTLWVNSIKHLGVAKSAILQSLIPVVTALAGMFLGSEILSPRAWLGVVIASAGTILSQADREQFRKKKRK